MGKIIIEDSAGNITEGNMSITSTNERGKYSVIVTAPAEFLNDSKTQYPVYIDPTIYITETAHYEWVDDEGNEYGEQYQAIVDLNVFLEEDAAATADLSLYSELGYFENDDARVIMKFYDFYGENGSCTSLDAGDIGKATLYFYVHSGVATTITAHPMTCTWNNDVYGENPTTLADVELWEGANPTVSSSISVGSAACEVAMDITAITKLWANSQIDPSYGLILDSSSSGYRMISSTENSDPYDIYLVLDTNETNGLYYIHNISTGSFVGNTSPQNVTSLHPYIYGHSDDINYIKWDLIYVGNNQYRIRAANTTNYLFNNAGVPDIGTLPTTVTDAYLWEFNYAISGILIRNVDNDLVLKYDRGAFVDNDENTLPWTLVTEMNSSNSDYHKTCFSLMPCNQYVNLTELSFPLTEWISVGSQVNCPLTIYPSNASWQSTNNLEWKSSNPAVATIDAVGRITAVGNGYTTIVVRHKPTGKTHMKRLVVGQMIENGVFSISNIHSNLNIAVEGNSTSEGASIEQSNWSTSYVNWNIIYEGNGYYSIQSCFSNKYITASSSNITQISTISPSCLWRVAITSSGNYKFISKTLGSVLSLATPSLTPGVNLMCVIYSEDNNFHDEWYLDYTVTFLARLDQDGAPRDSYINDSLEAIDTYASSNTMRKMYSSEFTKSEMQTIISHSKFFVIHTHGYKEGFQIGDSVFFDIADINNTDMSNVKLVVIIACNCGEDGYASANVDNDTPTNVVEACIASGATTCLAFSANTFTPNVDNWFIQILELMSGAPSSMTLEKASNELNTAPMYNAESRENLNELSDIDVIGGNRDICLSDIFE